MIEGLANTGRVITSAAAIMVCVFTSFVLNGNPVVKEFGVGLAVAIAIDSTLVRCLLVPAVMVLMGKPRLVAAALAGPASSPASASRARSTSPRRDASWLRSATRRGGLSGCSRSTSPTSSP